MKPTVKLDEVTTVEGKTLALYRRAEDFTITIDGAELMSSWVYGPEEPMAVEGLRELGQVEAPRVLIGGLGMGFSVRATLERVGPSARVTVAEALADVVRWNREWLGELAGHPLRDPRVSVEVRDVHDLLLPGRYHLILLDVDNGPDALVLDTNRRLYSERGIARCREALVDGGVLAVWSAGQDDRFLKRLRRAGLAARARPVRGRAGTRRGPRHTIFLGRRQGSA